MRSRLELRVNDGSLRKVRASAIWMPSSEDGTDGAECLRGKGFGLEDMEVDLVLVDGSGGGCRATAS